MTTNEQAHELYRAQLDLDGALAYIDGVRIGCNKRKQPLPGWMDGVIARIQSAQVRIKNASDPLGTSSPELPNVLDAIRKHAEAV